MERAFEILLVEDNAGDIELAERALRDQGPRCRFTSAKNGEEALQYLRKQPPYESATTPDIILLDLNMPKMGGLEFLEVAKSDAELKCIPVIMFTSSESPTEIRKCYERHANCYLVKPFDGKQFSRVLNELIRFWRDILILPQS